MRWLAVASTTLLLLIAAGPASAMDPSDCARMIREFQHYNEMLERAKASGNEVYINGMERHVTLIEGRLDARCPEYTADKRAIREAARQFAKLLKTAGKAAVTFFTMGAM
jgi:hypothetical protein